MMVCSLRALLHDINYVGEYWNVSDSWLASVKNKYFFCERFKLTKILRPVLVDTVLQIINQEKFLLRSSIEGTIVVDIMIFRTSSWRMELTQFFHEVMILQGRE
jgi:hypothetical protein